MVPAPTSAVNRKGRPVVYSWLHSIRSAVYPPTCLLCGSRVSGNLELCDGCHRDLPLALNSCQLCGGPLSGQTGAAMCGACQRHPPPFDRALVLAHYRPPVDRLIQRLKFSRQLGVARLLGVLLAERAAACSPLPQVLIPVPLHPKRLRERGFNQAMEIARTLGDQLGVPVLERACRRRRATPAQAGLSARARRANMRGAFAAEGITAMDRVAIVDDVMTTGNTAAELARTLRRRGVQRIEVWVCARTVREVS
ncbi:MAG: ComF family protein [Gammaproteobacteria bacterium]